MKRILVALDGSARAGLVLATAATLAERFGAELVLYRALAHPSELPRDLLAVTDARLTDTIEHNAREDLARLAAGQPPGRVAKIVTEFAPAWRGICEAARSHEADLIAIGSHGYGALERMLGTTAAKVVDHADRNVFVVRSRT